MSRSREPADKRVYRGEVTRWAIRILSAPAIPDRRGRDRWSCARPRRILLHVLRIFVFRELEHWVVEFQALRDP
jgi:hypothetical protein